MSWMDSLNAAVGKKRRKLDPDEREKIATDLVLMSSMGTAVLTLAPLPLTDFVVVTPVQAAMVMSVGRVYGRELDFDEAKHVLVELASVCGASLLAQKGLATLTKLFLPGLGGVLAGPYAFALTYAMGHVAMSYFEDTEGSRDRLRSVFGDALAVGKKLFSRKNLDAFRRQHGKDVEGFAAQKAGKGRSKGKKKKPASRRSA